MSTVEELREIIKNLEEEITRLKAASTITSQCEGVTGKGTPCRNRALPGFIHCRLHKDKPPKVKKTGVKEKVKKVAKVHPEHTHKIGEVPTQPCPLCETHGDVFDPNVTHVCYESPKRLWCDEASDDDDLPELTV
jgi:hypothetical protein|tara:strand:- start:147 stop:551 length:405 start_codon:yes stop_codon:yes gene_type:complete